MPRSSKLSLSLLKYLDEIWVRDTVNSNFMEGVLLVVSTGFAHGSIYGLTLFVHGYFAVLQLYVPVWIQYDLFGTRPFLKLS